MLDAGFSLDTRVRVAIEISASETEEFFDRFIAEKEDSFLNTYYPTQEAYARAYGSLEVLKEARESFARFANSLGE